MLVTVHALQFLKLYLLTRYEIALPEVTEHLVVTIMNVICEESNGRETNTKRCKESTLLLKQELLLFHREHYKSTMHESQVTNMAQVLLLM